MIIIDQLHDEHLMRSKNCNFYKPLSVYTFRCVGNVFKKVGKAAALAIGGGLLMLQVL